MLSEPERRVLAAYCIGHAVAACDDCLRAYKFTELGTDVVRQRYYFCPSCRLDLVDDLRLHILGCRAISAAVDEQIERSRQLVKRGDRLASASALLAAESEALARRVLEIKRESRHVPPANPIVEHITAVLADQNTVCVRCLVSHTGVDAETVMEHVDTIRSHIRIASKPGICPECGRQDLLLSFGDDRAVAD